MTADRVQRCLDAGRLAEAAKLLEADQDFKRALELYEQLWNFKGAARCALALEDLPRALDAALQHSSPALQEEILAKALHAHREVALACAATAEGRRRWAVAAKIYQGLNEHEKAAGCLESQGLCFEAARQYELSGQPLKALELYQQHFAELGGEPGRREPGHKPPELYLGRLLLRYGREEEALPWLQRARGQEQGNTLAGRAIVAAMARLGFEEGARFMLQQLQAGAPGELSLRTCLEDPELNPLDEDPQGGQRLAGRYQVGKLLGSGGMGRVHLGVDLLKGTEVAIKVFTSPGGPSGRDAYLRFIQEARTTGQLHHPHIVSLLDFHEGMRFMVLEYMVGGTLADRLGRGLSLSSSRSILLQILSGLEAAHQRGIVHRDIKPSNIFFTRGGATKLGDFGVAHLQESSHTQTGAFIGTLAFMSPEQITAGEISFATDFYALGVMLHLMTVGELPFQPPDLINQHLHKSPPKPSAVASHLPSQLDDVVLRCMAKDPKDRFESLAALRRAVEQLPSGAEDKSPGPRGAAVEAQVPEDHSEKRYIEVSSLHKLPEITIQAVHDNQLGRSVIMVTVAPGPRRQRAMELLAAAATGGVHLQRVVSIEPSSGQAILEQQHGDEFKRPADPLDALTLAAQLGTALSPLHEAGFAHGQISEEIIATVAGTSSLSIYHALLSPPDTAPVDDVVAVLKVTGVSIPPDELVNVKGGVDLREWATQAVQQFKANRAETRRQLLLNTAPAHLKKHFHP